MFFIKILKTVIITLLVRVWANRIFSHLLLMGLYISKTIREQYLEECFKGFKTYLFFQEIILLDRLYQREIIIDALKNVRKRNIMPTY